MRYATERDNGTRMREHLGTGGPFLDLQALQPYYYGAEEIELIATEQHVILNFAFLEGESLGWIEGEGLLGPLVPLRDVWVVANFKETQLSGVRVGDRAMVEVDMYPDVGIAGTVESIAPGSGAQFALIPPDNATGNFTKIPQRVPVKIVLDNDNPLAGKLYAGLSAEVTIALRERGDTDEGSLGLARAQED